MAFKILTVGLYADGGENPEVSVGFQMLNAQGAEIGPVQQMTFNVPKAMRDNVFAKAVTAVTNRLTKISADETDAESLAANMAALDAARKERQELQVEIQAKRTQLATEDARLSMELSEKRRLADEEIARINAEIEAKNAQLKEVEAEA